MNPLISPSRLATKLDDPNTVILDATLPPVGVHPPVDTHARYQSAHIPGAVFFDIDALSDHSTTLPHMLASAEDFAESMSSLGISDRMRIVVYEQEGVFSAPRAWWMFRVYGAQNVYILDGGLRAWVEAGFPVNNHHVKRERAIFQAQKNEDAVKNFAQIQQLIAAGGQILDARSPGRFNGTAPEPRPGISSGHMPGATNTPFTELVENGRFKPAEALREYFVQKGVDIEQPVTTTCGSGVTAAVIALGLEISGAKNVTLYDGSWAEYAQQPEAEIKTEK